MARIREETEVDRTEQALAGYGARLPLARGEVEISVSPAAAGSAVGQRILVLLVNELARMKGVVNRLHVVGAGNQEVLLGTPLLARQLEAGLAALVANLNRHPAPYRTEIAFAPAASPAARVTIGQDSDAGLVVAADGWRALFGRHAAAADWTASSPYGAALAAALAAAETFKQLLECNGGPDPHRPLISDLAYSAFNYGLDNAAAIGPDLTEVAVHDLAVVGCGAGGTAALYVLAMQPGLCGNAALIEPGRHKLSNLNRYLMTSSTDVHEHRHKLASTANHLAQFAPGLRTTLYPQPWEMLDAHPWSFLLSTVDTVEARWAIQARCVADAAILDAAVLDLLYNIMRVVPGGWCLECKHPYDSDLTLKQRAARWGQTVEIIRDWTNANVKVTTAMIVQLALTQNRPPTDYARFEGMTFCDVLPLAECGETPLRTDVPSQAPVLPIATTAAGVMLAGEIAKHYAAPHAQLDNWLAHDLARAPDRPRVKFRPRVNTCPRH
jgi:molybdopterin/thiamine biosynthesis adenylyltransferase